MDNLRVPTKESVFEVLKMLRIKTIVDVGVASSTKSLMEAWPQARHILIECNARWFDTYASTYQGMDYQAYHMTAGEDRIDTIPMSGPVLLKVDVDGPELEVLKSCEDVFEKIVAIVVEAVPNMVVPIISYLDSQDFELYDIVDPCYCGGQLHQCDLVFVRPSSPVRIMWDITKFQDTKFTIAQ